MTKYVYTYLLFEIGEMGEMDEIVEMVEIRRHFAHFARATSLVFLARYRRLIACFSGPLQQTIHLVYDVQEGDIFHKGQWKKSGDFYL